MTTPDNIAGGGELPAGFHAFVAESNRIEGIHETTEAHYQAHERFLAAPITIPGIIALVNVLQPDAVPRFSADVPGVRVGNHIAPPSGPQIELELRRILAMRDPWSQHVDYQILHPFTDGNGRSGRAIWLHRFHHEGRLDPWAIRRGFLHSFYYQTLSSSRKEPKMTTPATPDENGWLPIESAPKNGTPILICRFAPGTQWHQRTEVDSVNTGKGFGSFNQWFPPTHWHPLPAPPVSL